ncbi:hypothetical protein FHS57_004625 [Runella defluvii]|uniref:DUF7670 domain-containing protein n=1 Tax=Runella defluvii TaxID=370973 RepID=A0A7W5ZNH0_9BACT|nr:hypothetical protein [Runella defluvii]MBB3840605.1 hypothetical protein [Runella defluvii]
MNPSEQLRYANFFRVFARYTLLIITLLTLVFALLSGAETYGGGWQGIIKNSPNALPWAGLLLLLVIAWKWELIGGSIITFFGLFSIYFFNIGRNHFYWSTLLLTLFITLLGGCFLASGIIRRAAHSQI